MTKIYTICWTLFCRSQRLLYSRIYGLDLWLHKCWKKTIPLNDNCNWLKQIKSLRERNWISCLTFVKYKINVNFQLFSFSIELSVFLILDFCRGRPFMTSSMIRRIWKGAHVWKLATSFMNVPLMANSKSWKEIAHVLKYFVF